MKLRLNKNPVTGDIRMYYFYCPGCKYDHGFSVNQWRQGGNPVWEFNGDMEKPTFSPSLIVFKDDDTQVCHLYVRDGQIQFLSDCHHELKGQTVEMEDVN